MCEAQAIHGRLAIVVMGVSGAGKTTVARAIAIAAGCDFIEGDELHPTANLAKMTAGQPLTDEDRFPWLERIGAGAADIVASGRSVVVSCSALKRRYRDQLRARIGPDHLLVYLEGTRAALLSRLHQRHGHFMPASLLDSQLETLEPPIGEPDVLTFDIATPAEDIARMVFKHLAPKQADPRHRGSGT